MDEIKLAEFLFRLALLFTPGIIARGILGKLLFYKKDNTFSFVVHSFILGLLSYSIIYLVVFILQCLNLTFIKDYQFAFFKSIQNSNENVSFTEVFFACLAAAPIAYLVSYFENLKIINKTASKLNVSYKFAEPDVWGYVFNSNEILEHRWITVRDKTHDLMYQGKIRAFSDTYKEAELFLEDVEVFKNSSGDHLYNVSGVYLTLQRSDIEIEFYLQANEGGSTNEKQ